MLALDRLVALTAHLNSLLTSHATSRTLRVGDDGLLADAIEYASCELEGLRDEIEGERRYRLDEAGISYIESDEAEAARLAIEEAHKVLDPVVPTSAYLRRPLRELSDVLVDIGRAGVARAAEQRKQRAPRRFSGAGDK